MQSRRYNKIIGIGLQKTGTSTLEKMLGILGYRITRFDYYHLAAAINRDFKTLSRIAQPWEVLSDSPWNLIYKKLDTLFPNSKFILTVRDEKAWLNSLSNQYGGKGREVMEWIFGIDDPDKDLVRIVEVYQKHNQEVVDYFKDRSGDLLIVNWETCGWKELCEFLGREIPVHRWSGKSVELPWANKKEVRIKKSNSLYYKYLRSYKIRFRLFLINRFSNRIAYFFNRFKFLRISVYGFYNRVKYR